MGRYKHYGKDELQGQWLCWFSEHVYNHFRLQQGHSLVQEHAAILDLSASQACLYADR